MLHKTGKIEVFWQMHLVFSEPDLWDGWGLSAFPALLGSRHLLHRTQTTAAVSRVIYQLSLPLIVFLTIMLSFSSSVNFFFNFSLFFLAFFLTFSLYFQSGRYNFLHHFIHWHLSLYCSLHQPIVSFILSTALAYKWSLSTCVDKDPAHWGLNTRQKSPVISEEKCVH